MTVEISTSITLCQDDIIDTLVSFARISKGVAYQNFYRQYFKDVDGAEVERTYQLIRRAFKMSEEK